VQTQLVRWQSRYPQGFQLSNDFNWPFQVTNPQERHKQTRVAPPTKKNMVAVPIQLFSIHEVNGKGGDHQI
jgi:hypothetical protein